MKTLFAIAAVTAALAVEPASAAMMLQGGGPNSLNINGIAWGGAQANAPANDPRADSIGSTEMIAAPANDPSVKTDGKGQGGSSVGSNDHTDNDAFAGQPPPGDHRA